MSGAGNKGAAPAAPIAGDAAVIDLINQGKAQFALGETLPDDRDEAAYVEGRRLIGQAIKTPASGFVGVAAKLAYAAHDGCGAWRKDDMVTSANDDAQRLARGAPAAPADLGAWATRLVALADQIGTCQRLLAEKTQGHDSAVVYLVDALARHITDLKTTIRQIETSRRARGGAK